MQTSPAHQVRNYLSDTLTFFRSHLTSLFLIVLPYALLSELALHFYIQKQEAQQQLIAVFFVEMILFPILQTVIVLYMAAAVSGQRRSPLQCYSFSVQFWPRMLLLSVFTMVTVISGLSLFIVPGIYLLIRFSLSEMFCIIERQSLIASISSSFSATVPVTWVIVIGLGILFPAITATTLVISKMAHNIDLPLASFAATAVQGVLRSLYIIYLFRVFSAIRQPAC